MKNNYCIHMNMLSLEGVVIGYVRQNRLSIESICFM